jgi:hypothetical protein
MRNIRKEGQAKKNGRSVNHDQSSLKQEHNTPQSSAAQAPLAAVLATARVARVLGLNTIRSTDLVQGVIELVGFPPRQFTARTLARALAPVGVRPTSIRVGSNRRCQGYHVADILTRINTGGTND